MSTETRSDFFERMERRAAADLTPDKRAMSAEIDRQVAEYQRRGGTVQTINQGASAIPVIYNGNVISYDKKGNKL